MGDERQPTWHWDEQAALRAELAEQTEAAAAEIARLRAETSALAKTVAFWRGQAQRLRLALARARR